MTELGAFIALSALLPLIPGPDTTVVTRDTLVVSRSAGPATVVAPGLMVWSFAAALGVAAVIRASAPAFDALKIAGGDLPRVPRTASASGGVP